jgi:hypothetical protein
MTRHLEKNLHCIAISGNMNASSLQKYVSRPTEKIVYYEEESNFFEPPGLYLKIARYYPLLMPYITREMGDAMALSDTMGPWAADRAIELAVTEIGFFVSRRIRKILLIQEAQLLQSLTDIPQPDESNKQDEEVPSATQQNNAEEKPLKLTETLSRLEKIKKSLVGLNLEKLSNVGAVLGQSYVDGHLEWEAAMEEKEKALALKMERLLASGSSESRKRKHDEDDDDLVFRSQKEKDPFAHLSLDELQQILDACNELAASDTWGELAPPPEGHQIGAKIQALVEVLLEYQDESSFFCGIVFCQQRLLARVLEVVIRRHPLLSFVKSACLLGHGVRTNLYKTSGMSVKSQELIVGQFRTGSLNLLVATQVAEEGLDIKPCNCVIRFDMQDMNLINYVQSRGRARHKSSQFVVLAKLGDNGPKALLTRIFFFQFF